VITKSKRGAASVVNYPGELRCCREWVNYLNESKKTHRIRHGLENKYTIVA